MSTQDPQHSQSFLTNVQKKKYGQESLISLRVWVLEVEFNKICAPHPKCTCTLTSPVEPREF